MAYPADDCQSLIGRQLIHARSWGNRGRHVFDLFWTGAGVFLVLDHCSVPYSAMIVLLVFELESKDLGSCPRR